MRTRILSLCLALLLLMSVLPIPASAAVQVSPTEATIYAMDSWAEEFLSIPADCPTSVQLKVAGGGSATYRVISGCSVTVSDTGLVTPHYTTWYWIGGWGTTSEYYADQCDRITVEADYGDSVIRVYCGGESADVTVHVEDYTERYLDEQLNAFLSTGITAQMTTYQKLEALCQYVAGFNYDYHYSSAVGMLLSGGGDCWASTDMLVRLCTKLGIQCVARNGAHDPGAGSGHRNALAIIRNGLYYELEAGYSGSAPRYWSIKERHSLFCYSSRSDGISVYQYDGALDSLTSLEIPKKIDGKTVTAIGDNFIQLNSTLEEIVLPDTVKEIGRSAFNSCKTLKTLHLPAALTTVGDFAFTACTSLTNLTVSEQNKSFTVRDGALYDKKMTVLHFVPAAETLTVPEGVKQVRAYAAYYNSNLTQVRLPKSLQTIGEGGFGTCNALSQVRIPWDSALKTLDDYAFYQTPALQEMFLPAGCTAIGEYALGMTSATNTVPNYRIYGFSGSAAQTYAADHDLEFINLRKNAWITLYGDSFYFQNGKPLTGWHKVGGVCCFFDADGVYQPEKDNEEVRNAVSPGCTTSGYSGDVYCVCCGELLRTGQTIAPLGHDWKLIQTIREPTQDEAGEGVFRCARCGEQENREIPALEPFRFDDVRDESLYYFKPVYWAVNHDPQITRGTSPTTFSPKATCTRGDVMTFLWKAKGGVPPKSTENPFVDTKPGKYYHNAILWAVEQGITSGTDATHFSPRKTCTRAEVVMFLWRASGSPAPAATVSPFVDVKKGKYYYEAVLWAVEKGITKGTDATHFSPRQTCTRAQIVTFLYQCMGK